MNTIFPETEITRIQQTFPKTTDPLLLKLKKDIFEIKSRRIKDYGFRFMWKFVKNFIPGVFTLKLYNNSSIRYNFFRIFVYANNRNPHSVIPTTIKFFEFLRKKISNTESVFEKRLILASYMNNDVANLWFREKDINPEKDIDKLKISFLNSAFKKALINLSEFDPVYSDYFSTMMLLDSMDIGDETCFYQNKQTKWIKTEQAELAIDLLVKIVTNFPKEKIESELKRTNSNIVNLVLEYPELMDIFPESKNSKLLKESIYFENYLNREKLNILDLALIEKAKSLGLDNFELDTIRVILGLSD